MPSHSFRFAPLLALALCPVLSPPALAQITPDSTLGAESSVFTPDVPIQGELGDLIEGGAMRGGNLFHSFLEFNIDAGQRLYFANPAGIESILTRVTGGHPSNLFGTLGVDGAADLFLINPNGIVFGENAALDIQGSFYASTAEAILLGDGIYSATAPEQSRLLRVDPSALFSTYLSDAAGDIQNRGQLAAGENLTLAANNLDLQGQVAAGGDLTLLGNAVQIRDTTAVPFVGFAGGDLLVQGNEQVDIVALGHADSGLYSYGDMVLRSANPVGGDAHYWSGGSFRVEGLEGKIGDLFSPVDPIIRAFGDVEIGAYQGSSLHILAGGGVRIGTALITQPDAGAIGIDFLRETIQLSDGTTVEIDGGTRPTLDVRAGVSPDAIGLIPLGNPSGVNPAVDVFFDKMLQPAIPSIGDAPSSADIEIGDGAINAANGLVLLTNQYQPNPELEGDIVITGNGVFGFGLFARGLSAFSGQGGAVYLDARNDISVINSSIDTSGGGNVGNVVINAEGAVRFEQQNRRTVAASSLLGVGTGGNVIITANSLEMLNGAQLQSSTLGQGNSGSVIIKALDSVRFVNGSAALSRIEAGGQGIGGNVEIRTGTLYVVNGAELGTSNLNVGNAGNVVIEAREQVVFNNRGVASSSAERGGSGGNIEILTSSLLVSNEAQLNASTAGAGDSGDIVINASDQVIFDNRSAALSSVAVGGQGIGGDVVIHTGSLDVTNGAILNASVDDGPGDAGDVTIAARDYVNLQGVGQNGSPGGIFVANNNSLDSGRSGEIRITTPHLFVQDGAVIIASTLNDKPGGDIILSLSQLDILGGGQVVAGSLSTGLGGTIRIDAEDSIFIAGSDPNFASRVEELPGIGAVLIPQSSLSVQSRSGGVAGSIIIGNLGTTPRLELNNGGRIVAASAARDGGNIVIKLNNVLLLRNGSLISTDAGTDQAGGNGGNITITAPFIVAIPAEDSDITANAFTGAGGNVAIAARGIFGIEPRPEETPLSDITASSALGVSGTLAIDTLDTDFIQNSLTNLADVIIDTATLTANSCIARTDESLGSFTITGSGGLPQRPGDSSISAYPTGTVRTIAEPAATLQEPDGVYQLPDGRLVLSRACE